jgi:hypothetical protein
MARAVPIMRQRYVKGFGVSNSITYTPWNKTEPPMSRSRMERVNSTFPLLSHRPFMTLTWRNENPQPAIVKSEEIRISGMEKPSA